MSLFSASAHAWTNDPLTINTRIRKVHITELINTINAKRIASNCAPYNVAYAYSGEMAGGGAGITENVTPVRASHLNQMRTAISEIYTAAGQGAQFTANYDFNAAVDQPISLQHITRLRAAADNAPVCPAGPTTYYFCTSNAACGSGAFTSLAACELATSVPCYATQPLCTAAAPVDCACPGGVCCGQAAGTVCRASTSPCDPAETCTGGPHCPPDINNGSGVCCGLPPGSICRGSTQPCDTAEACVGGNNDCPPDAPTCTGDCAGQPVGFVCRAKSSQQCDVEEVCDGVSLNCPPDTYAPAGTVCRYSTATCDPAETCNGTSPICPSDINAGTCGSPTGSPSVPAPPFCWCDSGPIAAGCAGDTYTDACGHTCTGTTICVPCTCSNGCIPQPAAPTCGAGEYFTGYNCTPFGWSGGCVRSSPPGGCNGSPQPPAPSCGGGECPVPLNCTPFGWAGGGCVTCSGSCPPPGPSGTCSDGSPVVAVCESSGYWNAVCPGDTGT